MQTELFVAEISLNVHLRLTIYLLPRLFITTPGVHWPGRHAGTSILNPLNIYYNYMHHFIFITWSITTEFLFFTLCLYMFISVYYDYVSSTCVHFQLMHLYTTVGQSTQHVFLLLKSRCLRRGTYWVWAARCVTEVFESTFVVNMEMSVRTGGFILALAQNMQWAI